MKASISHTILNSRVHTHCCDRGAVSWAITAGGEGEGTGCCADVGFDVLFVRDVPAATVPVACVGGLVAMAAVA